MGPPFIPLPFLGNAHVQTILGNLLPASRVRLPVKLHVISLPDGDALAAHDTVPRGWRPGDPLAILVHGLGGCHRSRYLLRLTNLLNAEKVRVVRLDLRGAGAGVRLACRLYNAAASDDVRQAIDALLRATPNSPVVLAGFSLGGGIVLKTAGEARERPLPNLRAVAAVNPPLDLLRCSELLERLPFYNRYYARNLALQVQRHQRLVPGVTPIRFPRDLTLKRFDSLYAAPRGGFKDVLDYYHKASSLPYVSRIAVPSFLLTSRDDPFVAVESFERLPARQDRRVEIVDRGGHMGFVGFDGNGGLAWAERRVAQWLTAMLRYQS